MHLFWEGENIPLLDTARKKTQSQLDVTQMTPWQDGLRGFDFIYPFYFSKQKTYKSRRIATFRGTILQDALKPE